VVERLAEALAPPILLDGHEERITASVGVVLSTVAHERAEDMLRDADMALYRAKDAGRAGYALFDPAMQAALSERRALERDLWRALEENQFTLHYQPIVDLRTGRMVEAEALLRWDHPQRGPVKPDRFVPLAEACGAIRPLGRWVLDAACHQGRAWLDAYPDRPPLTIAVNLSAREFQDTGLVEAVANTLAKSGLPAHLLRLEITESAAMQGAEVSLRALNALRHLGVRLAIDDFGTGYSSLAYLQRFPVDTLKIDRAFIGDLATDERSAGICDAITTLARTLRLQVIAEGIETMVQAGRAIACGCDRAQGHYFSQSLSSEGLAALWEAEVRFDLPGGGTGNAQTNYEARTAVMPS
jgi:EAL domain-containing protein (putative c-di-GMP-specific phosphodiesterase class I)